MKTIYDLELHETMTVEGCMVVMRVASGWLYDIWDYENQQYKQGVFVPFDNNFAIKS